MSKNISADVLFAERVAASAIARKNVLASAIGLFAERGYGVANLHDIAGSAGVERRLIRRCIGTKARLFRAAIDALAPEIERRFAAQHGRAALENSGGDLERALHALGQVLEEAAGAKAACQALERFERRCSAEILRRLQAMTVRRCAAAMLMIALGGAGCFNVLDIYRSESVQSEGLPTPGSRHDNSGATPFIVGANA